MPKKDARNKDVVEYFDRIAPAYDRLNRIISWGQDQRWRNEIARRLNPRPKQIILDISAGTGDMEFALKKACSEVEVIGLDPSRQLIFLYSQKVPTAKLALGVVEAIPLQDESVASAVCTFGVRNFQYRDAAFGEIRRVLQPGGLWGFLEISAPAGLVFPFIYSIYFKRIVPFLGMVLSPSRLAYTYLQESAYAFPEYNQLVEEHRKAGFELCDYRPFLSGAVSLFVFQKQN
jgi:demethylmenaquinone methyltransferase/2-methoxy-6-polyprenyl-1,4-benzoquinol methylase